MDQVFKSQVNAIWRSIQRHDKHSIPMPNNTQWNSSVTSFRLAAGETYISPNEKKKETRIFDIFYDKEPFESIFSRHCVAWQTSHWEDQIAMLMKSKMHLHFRWRFHFLTQLWQSTQSIDSLNFQYRFHWWVNFYQFLNILIKQEMVTVFQLTELTTYEWPIEFCKIFL